MTALLTLLFTGYLKNNIVCAKRKKTIFFIILVKRVPPLFYICRGKIAIIQKNIVTLILEKQNENITHI